MFRDHGAKGHFVEDENQLGIIAARYLKPDVTFSPKLPEIGFIHRKLSAGDLYFLANTENHLVHARAQFRQTATYAEWWDPFTGLVSQVDNPATIDVALQPYESRLIFFTNSTIKAEPPRLPNTPQQTIDLSTDWTLSFGTSGKILHLSTLHSWSEEENFKYYSGQVTYERQFNLPANLASGTVLTLDFGEGTPVPKPDPLPSFNLRAFLEGPIREAADLYVNGQRAGVVWHPPYSVDLTSFLHTGTNNLRIIVGNTAINELAGTTLPDYRLLKDRYGERFVPQGMDNLQPLPSGLLGGVRLRVSSRR